MMMSACHQISFLHVIIDAFHLNVISLQELARIQLGESSDVMRISQLLVPVELYSCD